MPTVEIVLRTVSEGEQNTRKTIGSFTELKSAIDLGSQALQKIQQAYNATVGETIKYAEQVRQLSNISGESTESTSRFIQVLDDYKISADDAMVATRAMTKEGLTPNLQTLAKLSDEYLSINNVQERNEFILKNLGRSGLQWVEVLKKGSKAILDQGDAIDKNLVLTQKMVDDARRAEVAMDNWGDSINALKTQFSVGLLPAISEGVQWLTAWIQAGRDLKEQGNNFISVFEFADAFKAAREEQKAATETMLENADAIELNTEAVIDSEEALKAQEEAIKKTTERNRDYLSQLGGLTDQLKEFEKESQDIKTQQVALRQEMDKLVADGFSPTSDEVIKLQDEYDELSQKASDLADAQELAGRRMILSMLETRLAFDGLDARETEYLVKKGVEWGIYSDQAIAALREAEREVSAFVNQINGIPTDRTITFHVVTTGNSIAMEGGLNGINQVLNYAQGGSFIVPPGYGYEGFNMGGIATASGGEKVTISPRGDSGGGAMDLSPRSMKQLARILRDTLAN